MYKDRISQGFGCGAGACWLQTFLTEPDQQLAKGWSRTRSQNKSKIGAGANGWSRSRSQK